MINQGAATLRVLILNNDKSYGALLASVSKKQGHVGIVKTTPKEALEVLQAGEADIALVELEMKEESGVDFANEMVMAGLQVPIAFCIVGCREPGLIAQADSLGSVLPKIWTHTDLSEILRSFQRELREQSAVKAAEKAANAELAQAQKEKIEHKKRSTSFPEPRKRLAIPAESATIAFAQMRPVPDGIPNLSSPTLSFSDMKSLKELTRASVGAPVRVFIGLQTWAQVQQLCSDAKKGLKKVVIRAQKKMLLEQKILVALGLPDETVVSVAAKVCKFIEHTEAEASKRSYQLELVGLKDDEIAYLLSCAEQNLKKENTLAGTVDLLLNDEEELPSLQLTESRQRAKCFSEKGQDSLTLEKELVKEPMAVEPCGEAPDQSFALDLEPPAEAGLELELGGDCEESWGELQLEEELDLQIDVEVKRNAHSTLHPVGMEQPLPEASFPDGSLSIEMEEESDEVELEIEEFPTPDPDAFNKSFESNFEKGSYEAQDSEVSSKEAPCLGKTPKIKTRSASRQAKVEQSAMLARAVKAKAVAARKVSQPSNEAARGRTVKEAIAKQAIQAAARSKAKKAKMLKEAKEKRQAQLARKDKDIAITFNSIFPVGTDPQGAAPNKSQRSSRQKEPLPAEKPKASAPTPDSLPTPTDKPAPVAKEGDALISWSKPRNQ